MASSLTMRCNPCSELQALTRRKEANGLYVTDMPPGVSEEELYQLFGRIGEIADLYLPESGLYCLVHYFERRPVDFILMHGVLLYGRELRVQLRKFSDSTIPENSIPNYHEELMKSICQKENCKQQIDEFVKRVEPDETDLRKQYEACIDLENALKHLSPAYKIVPFGSSVNGLAFKDSDLDVFYGKELHSSGPDIKDVFTQARKALSKHLRFPSMRPIPNARVPIIKLVHHQTGFNFDLSFKNTMGVENSKMIKFLMSLDERVKPLFMIVKYWAKIHHLTGKRMSNYSLTLLLINFLQSLNEPILPPLCELQHDGIKSKRIGDWDARFDDDITRLRPISNDLPVEELLSRFFESVVKTDFDSYVVSPLLGCLLHKQSFSNLSLPPEMKSYTNNVSRGQHRLKMNSVLCIQDPIELNLNVTKNLPKHDFLCLREHCSIAAKLSYAVPPHLYLPQLLNTVYEYPRRDMKPSWLPNPMHTRPLKPFMTLHVPHPENLTDEVSWKIDLIQKITVIFKKVLKIDVTLKTRENTDTKPGGDQCMMCKGSQVLWKERQRLWNQWYSKESKIKSHEEVQVLDVVQECASSSHGSRAEKRKRNAEEARDSKRRKTEDQGNEREKSYVGDDADVIVIDSEETDKDSIGPKSHLVRDVSISRSLQDEINLTNEMVKKGHALPARSFILDFSCSVCTISSSKTSIEIADSRSRDSYFSSLCVFLQDFLNKHIIEASK